jgi:hypothetical protein
METRVDLAAMLGLLVSTLNTTVSKQTEIGKSDLRFRPSFSKEHKSLKTSPLEELETILSAWFKQACITSAATVESQLKEKALHVAAHLGIDSLRASNSWIDYFKKIHNTVYKTVSGESASINLETVMD